MTDKLLPEIKKARKADYDIHPLILNRWSPRAMTGESITDKELFSLFEAARWAPSSYNNQPWRIFYAKRNTPHWNTFFNLLIPFNQNWAQHAAALLLIASKTTFDHNNKEARTNSFDAGAAWENLALQATHLGLVAHGMEGFDYDKARKDLHIPDDYEIHAMAAIGNKAGKQTLPEELREKEQPSQRKPLKDIIREGPFTT